MKCNRIKLYYLINFDRYSSSLRYLHKFLKREWCARVELDRCIPWRWTVRDPWRRRPRNFHRRVPLPRCRELLPSRNFHLGPAESAASPHNFHSSVCLITPRHLENRALSRQGQDDHRKERTSSSPGCSSEWGPCQRRLWQFQTRSKAGYCGEKLGEDR